jgi:DNA mismatch repair ATPase MutS
MALRDDIFSNESYFITEIRSLKRMLDSVDGGVPGLCIVDEVLRGTNTGERIAAAAEALKQFSKGNCLCLAATHDIELTHILEGTYENMHFTETIEDGRILFDYKIRPGRSQSRNAIKLLGLLGYGGDLVEAANKRLEHFEKTGRWAAAFE